MTPRTFRVLVLATVLVSGGCVHAPPVRIAADAPLLAAQSARETALAADPDWALAGRLAVDAGGEGGSGSDGGALLLQVGDLIAFGVGHPCTTFDKWPLLYTVDDGYRVIGGVRTFF